MTSALKKFPVIASLLFASLVSGCSSKEDEEPEIIWDIYPVIVYANVVDDRGKDLLDPETEGNIVGQELTVEYDGEIYDTLWNTPWWGYEEKQTRYYMAEFHGILHHPVNRMEAAGPDNPYVLEIGELPGDESFDVTLPVRYGDKVFSIRVVHEFKWIDDNPSISTEIFLDGKKCGNPTLVL